MANVRLDERAFRHLDKFTNKKDELNAIYANIEGDDERYEDIKGELKGINRKLSTNNPLAFSGWRNPIDESATYWKNAKKNFDKHVERLAIFNIQLGTLSNATYIALNLCMFMRSSIWREQASLP